MTSVIAEYNRKIPEMMRKALEGFAKQEERARVMLLAEKGELSFKQLVKFFSFSPSTLNYHFKLLLNAELVENHYNKVQSTDEYSFYELTEFGNDFLKLIGAAK
jgi:DNA-binding transcriptional ArsR family regulator